MKVVLQRVRHAAVTINGAEKRSIGPGLALLVGVSVADTAADAEKLAQKCAQLRVFEDADGRLNRSALELGYEALVVSNFTLQADMKKGRRPNFGRAAGAPLGRELYDAFVRALGAQGLRDVKTGEFGADMQLELLNDGPVTLVLDTEEWKRPVPPALDDG